VGTKLENSWAHKKRNFYYLLNKLTTWYFFARYKYHRAYTKSYRKNRRHAPIILSHKLKLIHQKQICVFLPWNIAQSYRKLRIKPENLRVRLCTQIFRVQNSHFIHLIDFNFVFWLHSHVFIPNLVYTVPHLISHFSTWTDIHTNTFQQQSAVSS